jgi:phage replication-related protein YjqB (UPF0714/DUF867 family)
LQIAAGMLRRTAIAVAITLVGCVAEEESIDVTEEELSTADSFACFRPESTATYTCEGSPNLIYSTLCQEGASYHVDVDASAPDMTMGVIAPHGGKIEPNTDTIALGLAAELDLPHYVFIAHATDSCLDKYGTTARSNRRALHITSTHFNDARAESLMRSVNRGLAIHGHGGPNKICVGGNSSALRNAFKHYYDTYTKARSPSHAAAVDAPSDDDCNGITGTASANISNRSAARIGLQLELSDTIRKELVASKAGDRVLWNSFRNAVRAACRTSIGGIHGCG